MCSIRVRASVLAIVFFASGAGAGDTQPRPLMAVDRSFGALAIAPDLQAYHVAVSDALLGPSGRRSFEAVVIPSFQREWSVHIQESAAGPEVACTVMQRQLWGEMQKAGGTAAVLGSLPRDTWRFSAPLSADTAARLKTLWAALLAPGPQPEHRVCIDGTSLVAFQWTAGAGPRGGWVRCPSARTPGAEMIGIVEDLRKAAGSEGTDLARRDAAIGTRALRLLRQLEPAAAAR